MKDFNVNRVKVALNLEHNIVGLKFLDFQEDYNSRNIESASKRGPLCYQVREAMDGRHFKCREHDISCDYARYALGLSKPDKTILCGRSYQYCGLYESNSIAREITNAMKFIDQDIYGIEIGPLEKLDGADIVVIVSYAETIMRVMQGYAFKYGEPKNLCFYGNQAMCSDMVAKTYTNNDINISLMCKGMRKSGRFDKGEISVSVPINMFDNLVEGIVQTINPVNTSVDKKRILEKSADLCNLGVNLDMNYNYGIGLQEYHNRVIEKRKKENNK